MNVIKLYIKNKVVYNPDAELSIVCGNSDYQIKFAFDAEWSEFSEKTARFIFNDNVIDVLFSGDSVNIPIVFNTTVLKVGVFAENLCTTTSATISCTKSVRCEGGSPIEPTPSTYDEIMALLGDVSEALDELHNYAELLKGGEA